MAQSLPVATLGEVLRIPLGALDDLQGSAALGDLAADALEAAAFAVYVDRASAFGAALGEATRLRYAMLRFPKLGAAGLRALELGLQRNASLRALVLCDALHGAPGLQRLATAAFGKSGALHTFGLSNLLDLGDSDLAALAEALHAPGAEWLQHLMLRDLNGSETRVRGLSRAGPALLGSAVAQASRLHTLTLHGVPSALVAGVLGSIAAAASDMTPDSCALRCIDVRHAPVSLATLEALAELAESSALAVGELTVVGSAAEGVGGALVRLLRALTSRAQIARLGLSIPLGGVEASAVRAVATLVEQSRALRHLRLGRGLLPESAELAGELAQALRTSGAPLHSIDLDCGASAADAADLLAALRARARSATAASALRSLTVRNAAMQAATRGPDTLYTALCDAAGACSASLHTLRVKGATQVGEATALLAPLPKLRKLVFGASATEAAASDVLRFALASPHLEHFSMPRIGTGPYDDTDWYQEDAFVRPQCGLQYVRLASFIAPGFTERYNSVPTTRLRAIVARNRHFSNERRRCAEALVRAWVRSQRAGATRAPLCDVPRELLAVIAGAMTPPGQVSPLAHWSQSEVAAWGRP